MKRQILSPILIMLLALLSTSYIHAQAPEGIIYQAEARSANGRLIRNTNLDVKITILAGSPSGTVVWDGFYEVTTDRFGLFTIVIGEGTGGSFDFSLIDWGSNAHFLNVQIKRVWANWWIDMGTTQFLSVPYALHAKTASSVLEIDPVFTSSSAYWITSGHIANWDEAISWGDHSLAGYLTSQEWSNLSGIPEGFEDGIDDVDDADASSLNELQNLTLENDILKLSLTNDEVSLENYVSHWRLWGDDLLQFTGAVDIGDNYFSGSVLRVDGNVTVGKRGENVGTYGISGPTTESGLGLEGGQLGGGQIYLFGPEHASNPGEVHLKSGGYARILINPDGNVGIRNAAPNYNLDVIGDINFTGELLYNGYPYISNDADADPLNEIQDLTLIDDKLIISNNAEATEIDLLPYKSGGNTNGDMQYWDGTDWVMIPVGSERQFLSIVDGVPTWVDLSEVFPDFSIELLTIQPKFNTANSFTSGGSIRNGISTELIACGVCWSTSSEPTIEDDKTEDIIDSNGVFTSIGTGLDAATIYYVRAYATNFAGTSYGNQFAYSTPGITNSVTDLDGNEYRTVIIGDKEWMAENLRTTKYSNGDPIGTTTPATLDINSEDNPKFQWAYDGNETYPKTYGRLYTWYAVIDERNICPTGWHVATYETDWLPMIEMLGGNIRAGGVLKETGTIHWAFPNDLATDDYGFRARPGGMRQGIGTFEHLGQMGYWCLPDLYTPIGTAAYWMTYFDPSINLTFHSDFNKGTSVRCVKDF